MSYHRNDPSSLSFGRLLYQTADLVKQQQRQIEELKKQQLTSQEKLAGKELAAARRSERTRANQYLASYDTTSDQLRELNQSLLTTAQREQIRHNLNSMQAAQVSALPAFTSDAVARIQNWQASAALTPNQKATFAETNLPPTQETDFQKWDRRKRSVSGRLWDAKQQRAQYERDLMMVRAQRKQQQQSKSDGFTLGGMRPID